jgi:hypothetical protein
MRAVLMAAAVGTTPVGAAAAAAVESGFRRLRLRLHAVAAAVMVASVMVAVVMAAAVMAVMVVSVIVVGNL